MGEYDSERGNRTDAQFEPLGGSQPRARADTTGLSGGGLRDVPQGFAAAV